MKAMAEQSSEDITKKAVVMSDVHSAVLNTVSASCETTTASYRTHSASVPRSVLIQYELVSK